MKPGERQVAPDLHGIRRDHVARYQWAAKQIGGGKTVADFACGIGYGTRLIAEAGNRVTGHDIDREAIGYARKHYLHSLVMFKWADGAKPPRISAEVAVCFETIEHIRDPRPLLKALRKGARTLLASVPNETEFPWAGHAYHFRHYTQEQFQALLAECGWQVVQWWGQKGPESEVEKDMKGRTLIAVAKRAKAKAKRAPEPPPARRSKVPEHVAILGLGPSVTGYLELTKRMGGRKQFADETWCINALGDVFACDRIFHMDDVRIQEIRAKANPESNIAAMLKWLKTHPGPIITSRAHPGYPGLVEFPLEDVLNDANGFAYFNSTAAYAVAYAIWLGVKRLSIFGNDFTYENSHHAEKGRACVEFWIGFAQARGIKVSVPHVSSLLDACVKPAERVYGYDTLNLHLQRTSDGRTIVSKTARTELPTAEEIEARYDHTRHVNPILDKG